MTIVLLASVSLFALVVASHPILPDSDLGELAPTTSTFQTTIQTPFRIHPGQDNPKHDAPRFHSQKPQQEIYLSEPDAEDAAAIASLEISPGAKSSLESPLHDTIDVHGAFGADNALDDARVDHVFDEQPISEPAVGEHPEAPADAAPSAPLVVLAFSCVASFLALACVALTLYIINKLRSQMLVSKRAWELLPRFWSRPRSTVSQDNASATPKIRFLGNDRPPLQTQVEQQRLLHAEESSTESQDLRTDDRLLYFDATSDMESDADEDDEKYQDAFDTAPTPTPLTPTPTRDLALDVHAHAQSHLANASLPPSDCHPPPDQPGGDRSALLPLMREVSSNVSLSIIPSRPAWSVRAIDSPALGLPAREGGGASVGGTRAADAGGDARVGEAGDVDSATLQPLVHPHRRAYRSVAPVFDIALAMQLRPGLGIGISADSAWMVRFLMTIFGWFAVALTGTGARQATV